MDRHADTPATADAAAADARERQRATSEAEAATLTRSERAKRQISDIFNAEPGDDAIANAGKGSLLDSRWELARDSRLGVFNLRAYKPVYKLPVFLTSNVTDTPSSPSISASGSRCWSGTEQAIWL